MLPLEALSCVKETNKTLRDHVLAVSRRKSVVPCTEKPTTAKRASILKRFFDGDHSVVPYLCWTEGCQWIYDFIMSPCLGDTLGWRFSQSRNLTANSKFLDSVPLLSLACMVQNHSAVRQLLLVRHATNNRRIV